MFIYAINYSSSQGALPLLSFHTEDCIHPVYPTNVHFYASPRTGSVSGTFSLLLNMLEGNFSATSCLHAAVFVLLALAAALANGKTLYQEELKWRNNEKYRNPIYAITQLELESEPNLSSLGSLS